MAEAVALALGLDARQVLTASTGVIGQRLDVEKIVAIVPALVDAQVNTAENFATAVMTTDLVPKTVTTTVKLKAGEVRVTGIAKGSGMIHPNMATMLGYLMTDLRLETDVAHEMLKQAVNPTFNMISVDGEPSPCDSVFLLANGRSGVGLQDDEDYRAFLKTLTEVSKALAKSIVKDGEGATKLIEVRLAGAPDQEKADAWARNLTVSPLIKTAVHGCDPNWGRIVSRLGSGGVPMEAFAKIDLTLQGEKLIVGGDVLSPDLALISQKLKQDEILIEIDLKLGKFKATAWGCDLSKMYVQINAEYTT
jgi:glutamate N-acetyltransferase/amino-acid N-acetyltransferase